MLVAPQLARSSGTRSTTSRSDRGRRHQQAKGDERFEGSGARSSGPNRAGSITVTPFADDKRNRGEIRRYRVDAGTAAGGAAIPRVRATAATSPRRAECSTRGAIMGLRAASAVRRIRSRNADRIFHQPLELRRRDRAAEPREPRSRRIRSARTESPPRAPRGHDGLGGDEHRGTVAFEGPSRAPRVSGAMGAVGELPLPGHP